MKNWIVQKHLQYITPHYVNLQDKTGSIMNKKSRVAALVAIAAVATLLTAFGPEMEEIAACWPPGRCQN